MKKYNEKEIFDIIKTYSPMYKPEIIRLNISSTFMVKARCKECGKGPDYYYSTPKPYRWKSARYALVFSEITRRWIQRMVNNWYLEYQPKHFHSIEEFSFKLEDKGYRPVLARTRGNNGRERENVIEFVGCSCGATVWAFNDKSSKNNPEITNRKGRYKYPQKFVR